ncbi:helix-turn-helix transcriptional regulator [Conexibacter sp. JD483]|uniref:helix-turn-helix domain-containing protein n=1 Tax=unclassified Conexibacter TaxID=2627773 RepID=UPI0027200114|nr:MULTISPECIES: helix-turn-helix transcriptional regulator [unclassified Conexibacter]MDO8185069.1 helix-turn-helix transcriptional regulator [Conexibacter sp. CPCC 205706]MDO8196779.1 helix-turn-helix transcriptional regulator [Conexibacter sp. CPCC 205762]MDR9368027.1 helix-turn-helix transcriptional regulator [Conexibacter sp. JD483]
MQVRVHTDPPLERRAFGAAVRELRGRRGLSVAQLGALAQIHDGYLRAVERADVEPGLRTMGRIAGGLGVSLSTLVVCAERRAARLG